MLDELILKNRSYRKFDQSAEIPSDLMKKWINNVRLVSSAYNSQPLRYIVCLNESMNEKIFGLLKWAAKSKDWSGPEIGEHPSCYIVLLADNKISISSEALMCCVGIACQTLLLQMVEDSYGGCMIGNFDRNKLIELLNVKNDYTPLLVLAIGKPAENIILEDIGLDQSTSYYNKFDGHHVPKLKLEDVIVDFIRK